MKRMKNKTHQTAHQQSKSLKNILYVWDGINQNQNRITNKMGGFPVEGMGKLNIFLVQNKGKGPPGRQRSPGYYADHPPDGLTRLTDNAIESYNEQICKIRHLVAGTPNKRYSSVCLSSVFPERKAVEGNRRPIRNNFNTEYQIDDNNKYNSLMIKFLLS